MRKRLTKKKYFGYKKEPKQGEAIVFDPPNWKIEDYPKHPLKRNQLVYYISDIPNVPDHCIVAKRSGEIVCMVHPSDFRKATDAEL